MPISYIIYCVKDSIIFLKYSKMKSKKPNYVSSIHYSSPFKAVFMISYYLILLNSDKSLLT